MYLMDVNPTHCRFSLYIFQVSMKINHWPFIPLGSEMHCDVNILVSKDTNTLTNKEYVRELHLH